jgi:hypothetical protein
MSGSFIDGDECEAARSDHFTLRERPTDSLWIGSGINIYVLLNMRSRMFCYRICKIQSGGKTADHIIGLVSLGDMRGNALCPGAASSLHRGGRAAHLASS